MQPKGITELYIATQHTELIPTDDVLIARRVAEVFDNYRNLFHLQGASFATHCETRHKEWSNQWEDAFEGDGSDKESSEFSMFPEAITSVHFEDGSSRYLFLVREVTDIDQMRTWTDLMSATFTSYTVVSSEKAVLSNEDVDNLVATLSAHETKPEKQVGSVVLSVQDKPPHLLLAQEYPGQNTVTSVMDKEKLVAGLERAALLATGIAEDLVA